AGAVAGPDAVSTSLTALMVVALAVMVLAALSAAALTRGIVPSLVEMVYAKLWMFGAAVVVVGVAAAGLTYVLVKKKTG
ncbi:MAG: hypothetical protein D6788_02030, partial [Planctomycetota bacterium]